MVLVAIPLILFNLFVTEPAAVATIGPHPAVTFVLIVMPFIVVFVAPWIAVVLHVWLLRTDKHINYLIAGTGITLVREKDKCVDLNLELPDDPAG
jgi:hypothetical protein